MKKRFPKLSIVKSSDVLLEIMGKGITKADGVRRVCSYMNIPPEKAVAFGDHFNDAEMLRSVGFPFLMGNAPEELKKEFSCVIGSNDDESISEAFRSIGLLLE